MGVCQPLLARHCCLNWVASGSGVFHRFKERFRNSSATETFQLCTVIYITSRLNSKLGSWVLSTFSPGKETFHFTSIFLGVFKAFFFSVTIFFSGIFNLSWGFRCLNFSRTATQQYSCSADALPSEEWEHRPFLVLPSHHTGFRSHRHTGAFLSSHALSKSSNFHGFWKLL